ncbi:acyl carrier protein [Dactylosporangium sp. CA-092794]|uniref:acyl carrier protein n=1 Tax=Dactylosporangium sp. CA-092794 TaxID=3239929 RepID=UPI003D8C8D53
MTTTITTLEHISDIVVEVVPDLEGRIQPTARLGAELGVDSLSIVNIVMKIEQVFGIAIDDNEFDQLQSVQDIFDLVLQRQ